jgi:hypothetical protein
MPAERAATVWAATFVPSRSPIAEFGQDGYSVAWVDSAEGRQQVLVDGARPAPGTRGRIVESKLGDETLEMFVADPA